MMRLQHRFDTQVSLRAMDAACVQGLGNLSVSYPATPWLINEHKQASGANP